jgi:pimeloyl-ACP methyl ester carboxylesterase/DNA-binding SARP family transcriptional activator
MLYLLGRPAVAVGAQLSPLALRPKALALLAYLALTERPLARREAARLFFPEAEDPMAVLRWHLTHLRSAAPPLIAERLRATRDDIALSVPTDVTSFRQGADRVCASPEVPDAPGILGLYRDDLLAGIAVSAAADFDNWLYVERENLQRRFRQATVVFARWALEQERVAEALGPLSRLVSVDPYFENGRAFLIHAYDALGQHGSAAAAYERYQRIVRHELSAEPRPSLARRFETNPAPGPTLPREDLIPLREVTIHVVDWPGEEPVILAIHGSAGMVHTLGAVAEQLAPTSRFVALDLRGHGLSDKPPSGYSLDHHVEDVLQLIDALGLRRPVLLGHSAGGTIAAFVAASADVSGLILLEGMIGDRAFAENAAAQAAPLADALERSVACFDVYLKEWLSQQAYSDEAERLLQRWVRYALVSQSDGTYRRRGLRSALEAEWASIIAADSLGALGRVSCPTLIVQALEPWLGDRPYFTEGIVEAQLRAAPRAELFVARHSDHATMIRDPEPDMIEAIKQFVRRCRHVAA